MSIVSLNPLHHWKNRPREMTTFETLVWIGRKLQLGKLIGLLVLLLLCAIAASILQHLEKEADEKSRSNVQYVVNNFESLNMNRLAVWNPDALENETIYMEFFKEQLSWIVSELQIEDHMVERMGPTPWSFAGAFFVTVQTFTTIGYGYPQVKTNAGRIFVLAYGLFLIIYYFLHLRWLGKEVLKGFKKLHQVSCRNSLGSFLFGEVGGNNELTPVRLPLVILSCYIGFCAAFVWNSEDHLSVSDSLWLVIISMLTVGFGDVMFRNHDMLYVYLSLILIGMILCTMIIELMAENLGTLAERWYEEMKNRRRNQTKVGFIIETVDFLICANKDFWIRSEESEGTNDLEKGGVIRQCHTCKMTFNAVATIKNRGVLKSEKVNEDDASYEVTSITGKCFKRIAESFPAQITMSNYVSVETSKTVTIYPLPPISLRDFDDERTSLQELSVNIPFDEDQSLDTVSIGEMSSENCSISCLEENILSVSFVL